MHAPLQEAGEPSPPCPHSEPVGQTLRISPAATLQLNRGQNHPNAKYGGFISIHILMADFDPPSHPPQKKTLVEAQEMT